MADSAARLDAVVRAVCPIDGVSVHTPGDPASVRVDFAAAATPEQRAAAQAVVDAFDWSTTAQAAWQDGRQPERKAIRDAAAGAVADNDAYLALATPTNAQVAAQVRRLTQQSTRVIRRLVQLD